MEKEGKWEKKKTYLKRADVNEGPLGKSREECRLLGCKYMTARVEVLLVQESGKNSRILAASKAKR